MKYMTFHSSCSYAGLANLLENYGLDVEDRQIALDMGLPFLFSCEDGVYSAGPMLQTADWFHLFLKPRGLHMTETQVTREEVGRFLRSVPCGMLGLVVAPGRKHAVVYTGICEGKYRFLNNKWKHSPEPELLLLTEDELLTRLNDTAMIATLTETMPQPVVMTTLFQESVRVLHRFKRDLLSFCEEEHSPRELADGRDRLFRAILLDAVTMLDLIGAEQLKTTLLSIQRQFLDALKEGTPQILQNKLSMNALESAVDAYAELIREHMEKNPRQTDGVAIL